MGPAMINNLAPILGPNWSKAAKNPFWFIHRLESIGNSQHLEKDLGIRVDGIIGMDVLGLNSFGIDYTTRKIVFGAAPVYGSVVPLQSTPPWLTVPVEMDGVSVRLLVDTAASGIILFQNRIGIRLPLLSLGERKSSNLGAELRLQRVMLGNTKFGETDFGQMNAFVVKDQGDESREFDGLLAPTALGLKQIAFDFQRQTLSWKK
jgi:hypothetical protein